MDYTKRTVGVSLTPVELELVVKALATSPILHWTHAERQDLYCVYRHLYECQDNLNRALNEDQERSEASEDPFDPWSNEDPFPTHNAAETARGAQNG